MFFIGGVIEDYERCGDIVLIVNVGVWWVECKVEMWWFVVSCKLIYGVVMSLILGGIGVVIVNRVFD